MKAVDIKDQVRLPLSKCVELVLSGIKYRLFRASITVIIIALATAFLMTMLTESIISRRVADVIEQETTPRKRFLFWVSRITSPLTQRGLTAELRRGEPGSTRWKQLKDWGDLSDEEMARLSDIADQQDRYYMSFFNELNEGDRRALVGRAQGTDIFIWLLTDDNFEQFSDDLRTSREKMDRSLDEFREFLDRWGETRPLRQQILSGHQQAIDSLRESIGGERAIDLFANADESLIEALREHGFYMSEDDLKIVRREAALAVDASRIASAFNVREAKRELADRLNREPTEVGLSMLFEELDDADGAAWFLGLARNNETIPDLELSAERVQEVARAKLRESHLSRVEATVSQNNMGEGGVFGFSGRMLWLIVVSFLVCIVGIANAMLMSVTERFREIATMKCLGATDGFIMINFVMESVMQGVAGGVIGMMLGFVLGLLRGWATYGWIAIEQMPLMNLLSAAGLSLVVGIVISALAAVYPAWIAARLAPMEAMRIE